MKYVVESCYNEEEIKVISADGEVSYGIKKDYILGNSYYAVGIYNTLPKLFERYEKNIEPIVDWILEDIASAVGETYVISY